MIKVPKNSFKFVIINDGYGYKIRCYFLRKKFFFFGKIVETWTDVIFQDSSMADFSMADFTFYGETVEECEEILRKYFRKKNEKIIREISLEEIYENCQS